MHLLANIGGTNSNDPQQNNKNQSSSYTYYASELNAGRPITVLS